MGSLPIVNSNKKIYIGAASANSGNTAETVIGVCMMSATTGIILYQRTSFYAKFFTIAADRSISYGKESYVITNGSFTLHKMLYCPSQNAVLLAYATSTNTALYIRTLTVSGTTVNYSSATTIYSTDSSTYSIALAYDPVISGAHVTVLRYVSSAYSIQSCAVTGASLTTVSTIRVLLANTQAPNLFSCYNTATSRLILSYQIGVNNNITGVAASYSSGNYTVGSAATIESSATSNSALLYDARRDKIIFTFRKNNHINYNSTSISNLTLTAGTTVASSAPTAYYMNSIYDQRSSRIFSIGGTGSGAVSCFLATYLTSGGFGFSKTISVADCDYTYCLGYFDGTIVLFGNVYGATTKLKYIKIS